MTRRHTATVTTLALAALAALPAGAAGARKPPPKPPKLDGVYVGVTSQTSTTPVYSRPGPQPALRLAVTGRRRAALTQFGFDYIASCPDGKTYRTHIRYQGDVRIGRRNAWSATFRYSPSDIDGALVGRVTYTAAGRFPTNSTARGTFQATVVVSDADTGQTIDTCRTPRVTWSATKQGAASARRR